MTRNQLLIVAALTIGVILEFCLIGIVAVSRLEMMTGQQVAAVIETRTPTVTRTPTDTRTPTAVSSPTPTATWVIQRYAPRPLRTVAARTPVPGPLQDGWVKASRVEALRFELDMKATGALTNLPGIPKGAREVTLMNLSGEANSGDAHFTLKGYIVSSLTNNPDKGIEFMLLGTKTYIHGPIVALGATANKWYWVGRRGIVGPGETNPSRSLSAQNPDWATFSKAGSEKLDSKRCDVYRAGREASDQFYYDFTSTELPYVIEIRDSGETKIWICDDGYMHQLRMDLVGHSVDYPDQKTGLEILVHFFDQNGNIKITAPPDAVPLEAPVPKSTD